MRLVNTRGKVELGVQSALRTRSPRRTAVALLGGTRMVIWTGQRLCFIHHRCHKSALQPREKTESGTSPAVYEAAFAGTGSEKQETLHRAESDLQEALMYKRNWIPAQTYLAQVFQAQGNLPAAAQQLQSVLGKVPPP